MLLLGEQDFAASNHDSFDANSLVMVTLRQATSGARMLQTSPKPTCTKTSGALARCHLSDYRLVARHNFRVARYSGAIPRTGDGRLRIVFRFSVVDRT